MIDEIHLGPWEDVMPRIDSGSVDLIITSPPYNVNLGNNKHKKDKYDTYDDNMPYEDYLIWICKLFVECNRVLKSGGRLCVNIGDGANGSVPTHADFTYEALNLFEDCAQKDLDAEGYEDFKMMTTIVWDKNQIGASTAWGCYDDRTRVLTQNGFKYFKDVDIHNEKIATVNPKTRELEYHFASNKIEKPYNGKMLHFKNKTIDLMVTPNHNMVYKKKRDIHGWHFRRADECVVSESCFPQRHNGLSAEDVNVFVLPKVEMGKRAKKVYVQSQKNLNISMDLWLKFLGIFFTDGNVYFGERSYTVSIYQSKPDYIDEIKQCLDMLPFDFKYKSSKNEWYCCSKQLASYLSKFKNSKDTILPSFIDTLSQRQKRLFIKWVFMGDGTIRNNKLQRMYAMESTYANQMARLLIEAGYSVSIKIREPSPKKRTLNGKTIRENKKGLIIYVKSSENYRVSKRSVSEVKYQGTVYCLTVPNHIMIVERNGKISICGNSWQSPSQPSFPTQFEFILVFCKGTLKHEGDKNKITVDKDEFIRNSRALWTFPPETDMMKKYDHPAMFPEELPQRLIQQLSYADDVVLDPFSGAGTTCAVAKRTGRKYIGIEMSEKYHKTSKRRVDNVPDMVVQDDGAMTPSWML